MNLTKIKLLTQNIITIENNCGTHIWQIDKSNVTKLDSTPKEAKIKREKFISTKSLKEFEKIIKTSENAFKSLISNSDYFIKKSNEKEIRNLKFLQDKDINCPEYIDSFEQNGHTYLITKNLEGETLYERLRKLDKNQIKVVKGNLFKEIDKIRTLKFPFKETNYVDEVFKELDITSETTIYQSLSERLEDNDSYKRILYDLAPKDSDFVLSLGCIKGFNLIVKDNLEIYITEFSYMAYLPEYWDIFKLIDVVYLFKSDIIEYYKPNKRALLCLINYIRYFFPTNLAI